MVLYRQISPFAKLSPVSAINPKPRSLPKRDSAAGVGAGVGVAFGLAQTKLPNSACRAHGLQYRGLNDSVDGQNPALPIIRNIP